MRTFKFKVYYQKKKQEDLLRILWDTKRAGKICSESAGKFQPVPRRNSRLPPQLPGTADTQTLCSTITIDKPRIRNWGSIYRQLCKLCTDTLGFGVNKRFIFLSPRLLRRHVMRQRCRHLLLLQPKYLFMRCDAL